ncbi:MAG: Golgi-to-ER vesicle coat component [Phylliscum demangeonii]|nr:MAG: Golgi-to-ER vesicle coat component [Phylliscum demangeonii]
MDQVQIRCRKETTRRWNSLSRIRNPPNPLGLPHRRALDFYDIKYVLPELVGKSLEQVTHERRNHMKAPAEYVVFFQFELHNKQKLTNRERSVRNRFFFDFCREVAFGWVEAATEGATLPQALPAPTHVIKPKPDFNPGLNWIPHPHGLNFKGLAAAASKLMGSNLSLFAVNAILILSTDDSSRILAKYYSAPHPPAGASDRSGASHPGANPYPTLKEQKAFEKGLGEKTCKLPSDIILYDNRIVVFKMESDVMIYVVGGANENEILLYNLLLALRDSLTILLKNPPDKRSIIENYDLVSLAIDEMVDDGIILETDPAVVVMRVSRPPLQDAPSVKNIDLSEQGLLNAWEFGKMKLTERLRQGL